MKMQLNKAIKLKDINMYLQIKTSVVIQGEYSLYSHKGLIICSSKGSPNSEKKHIFMTAFQEN